ncbi:AIPR family protein [Umezawaea sp. NPDC059074]|uniref:AIPR family protein n=1 Tax=Umezawaea sp. NPDC059074 TaxID=3346716 RepID=UPI0036952F24
MSESPLEIYAKSLVAEVQEQARTEGTTTPEAFTRMTLDDLTDISYIQNAATAYHKSHGHEIHGYGFRDDDRTLDLFTTDFTLDPMGPRLTKTAATSLFKRLLTFIRRSPDLIVDVEDAFDVHDMCVKVSKSIHTVEKIRLFILSNRMSSAADFTDDVFDGIPVSQEVWDLARLFRVHQAGSTAEPISVVFDPPIGCVAAPASDDDVAVVLATVPGKVLADLYEAHDTRLLELNVRSFLQTRGAVNKGIRDTLLNAPRRFLAYNNGITVTASGVDFVHGQDGEPTHISAVHEIQVVNGGQTTATLHHVLTKDKNPLSGVYVQMKLTTIASNQLQEIVPKISEYSNSQNRVTLVDFSSNHAFHVDFQRKSRLLLANGKGGSGKETRWFFERARGQYTDRLSKAHTPARQREFKAEYPPTQKFNKADLAKYIHSWCQHPHHVSRGAQKNFGEFMIRLGQRSPYIDATYCRRVIAMAILFKGIDKIAATHQAGNIKSFVTTYTMARLALATGQRVDLDRIWHEQQLSDALDSAVHELVPLVMDVITRPRGPLVSEWAKKEDCWRAVSAITWKIPKSLKQELREEPIDDLVLLGEAPAAPEQVEVSEVPAEEWHAIAFWVRETRSLSLVQSQIALRMGKMVEAGDIPNAKLIEEAEAVRQEAVRLGFAL